MQVIMLSQAKAWHPLTPSLSHPSTFLRVAPSMVEGPQGERGV